MLKANKIKNTSLKEKGLKENKDKRIQLAQNIKMCEVEITAICDVCRRYHVYSVTPDRIMVVMGEWDMKHQKKHRLFNYFCDRKKKIASRDKRQRIFKNGLRALVA